MKQMTLDNILMKIIVFPKIHTYTHTWFSKHQDSIDVYFKRSADVWIKSKAHITPLVFDWIVSAIFEKGLHLT
jgi:hypothetical protein